MAYIFDYSYKYLFSARNIMLQLFCSCIPCCRNGIKPILYDPPTTKLLPPPVCTIPIDAFVIYDDRQVDIPDNTIFRLISDDTIEEVITFSENLRLYPKKNNMKSQTPELNRILEEISNIQDGRLLRLCFNQIGLYSIAHKLYTQYNDPGYEWTRHLGISSHMGLLRDIRDRHIKSVWNIDIDPKCYFKGKICIIMIVATLSYDSAYGSPLHNIPSCKLNTIIRHLQY